MSDETIGPSLPIGSRDPRPADRDEPAPDESGTVANQENRSRVDDVPETLAGTFPVPGSVAEAVRLPHPAVDLPQPLFPGRAGDIAQTGVHAPPGPQPMDARAALDVNPQGGSAPPGAFDQTELATGASGPENEGGTGTLMAETQIGTGAERWDYADFVAPRSRCGHYVLKQFYAKGGMGEVWLAEDPVIGRSVALKRMLGKNSDQGMRFRVEAKITGQLEHPGIVPVHELGTNAEGEPYYVMKFVQGRTLQKVIQEFHAKKLTGGAHEVEQLRLLQMFVSLCQTVGYAHSRGVIHRDLKPDNVMLGPYGETILLDWGIAKVLGQKDPAMPDESGPSARLRDAIPDTGTHAGAIMGTPSYMAPEVAAGLNEEVDERSDIYLLGATLYQILSGRKPRTAKTFLEMIYKAAQEPPDPVRSINPLVPRALNAICHKAMAHAKEDRYQTATELAEDIQRFLAGEPVSAYRESFPARSWRWAKRHRRALGLSAAAVLIGSSALFAAIKVRDAEHRRAEAAREADHLKAQERARSDLKKFRHLADEANFFAATTNPASEHAPYFDPHKGTVLSRAALELAKSWGPALEALPLPEERTAVKSELHDLLVLAASETLRAEPGHAGARQVLATLDRAVGMGGSSVSDFRLRAGAYEQLGDEKQAAEMRRRAEDPKTPRTPPWTCSSWANASVTSRRRGSATRPTSSPGSSTRPGCRRRLRSTARRWRSTPTISGRDSSSAAACRASGVSPRPRRRWAPASRSAPRPPGVTVPSAWPWPSKAATTRPSTS